MSGHTPGPWIADNGDGKYFCVGAKQNGEIIAILSESKYSHDMPLPNDDDFIKWMRGEGSTPQTYGRWGEHEANARLIAAAPEMRELIDVQAHIIDALIERLREVNLIDDMDSVEFNQWSQAYQMLVAKIEGMS